MNIIVCLDDKNGMMFNKRRQSKDSILRKNIYKSLSGKSLWMNEYSYQQFEEDQYDPICVDEQFMEKVKKGEYCFVENIKIAGYKDSIEKMIVYKWNRNYPSDFKLDLSLDDGEWILESTEEFAGNSHEKITKEEYGRHEK